MRGRDAEVDPEVTDRFREYRFRKTFGGSHWDFLEQPRQTTEWLLAIDSIVNEVQSGE